MTTTAPILDREEYVEQAYFFRTFRDRFADGMPAQDILERVHEEILTTTRLPYAIQFLSAEVKHSGQVAGGFAKLPHYFTGFQAFVMGQAERDASRFTMGTALQVLEREAQYKAKAPTRPGLFVYQFEAITRNRLGFADGLAAMARDPHYDPVWADYIAVVARQIGAYDFSDLVYIRSDLYVLETRRDDPEFTPKHPPIFGEKEGKIAKASRGRDPLFLFAALQRQLDYPEVPRVKERDDATTKVELMQRKIQELEMRIKLVEGEVRGNVDLTQFGKPDLLKDDDPE